MAEILLAEQTLEFSYLDGSDMYMWAAQPATFELVDGSTYTVEWDGVKYECLCKTISDETGSIIYIGNAVIAGEIEDTGEPFIVSYVIDTTGAAVGNAIYTTNTAETHTVAIYSGVLEEEPSENEPIEEEKVGANIVLFDRNGNEVTYEGIETVTFNTDVEGETATYTHGTVPDEVPEVAVDFTDGNQIVNAETGKLIKSVVIKKPETLLAENIKKGVEVAGVLGEFIGNEMEKTVELAMADGDQVIEADADTVMAKVTVKKPETLIPENILDGVNIGEVVGNHKDKIEIENMEIKLDVSEGDQLLSAPEGYVVKTAVIKKPETMIPENIKKNTSIAGVKGILNSIEDVVTAEEMNALLVSNNVGNAYRFIGETTENYINGDIYVVEESV